MATRFGGRAVGAKAVVMGRVGKEAHRKERPYRKGRWRIQRGGGAV